MRAPLSAVVGISVCCLLLAGCRVIDRDAPEPTPSSESGTPSASPSPAVDGIAIPTDCAETMSSDMYQSTFAEVPLNDPTFGESGVLIPDPEPAEGADVQQLVLGQVSLRCIWRDPVTDRSKLELELARVDPAAGAAYLEVLADSGYECEERYEGEWCQRITSATGGAEMGSTKFVREGVYIGVEQTAFPTNGFLADVVETLWGE